MTHFILLRNAIQTKYAAVFPIVRSIFSPRMLAILVMGFVSGLPLLLIGSTLKAWLHDEHINLTTIGLFTLVGLPYALKFLWSPFLDRFTPPFLDRRRGWMLIWQILLIAGIGVLALCKPSIHPIYLGIICLCIAFFSASQDIAIDAYRRDILGDEELGFGFSLAITGYRLGMLLASAGALTIADFWGWQTTYLLMAAAMLIGVLTSFLAPKVKPVEQPHSMKEAVMSPFLQFFSRKGAWVILLFILLYKVGDQMASEILNPFYLELGFTKAEIGLIAKSFGLGAMIAGGMIGGLLIYRLKIYRALWVFGILQGVSTFAFSLLANMGASFVGLAGVVSLESFASGMGGAAYAAFIASLCDKRFTATQYALFSSLIGVTRVFFGASSGFFAQNLGWFSYFVFCSLLAIPGLLLLAFMHKKSMI